MAGKQLIIDVFLVAFSQLELFEPGLRPFTPPQGPQELTRENTAATYPDNAPRQVAAFWVARLAGGSIQRYRLSTKEASERKPAEPTLRPVGSDGAGWPSSLAWQGMGKPLAIAGRRDDGAAGAEIADHAEARCRQRNEKIAGYSAGGHY